MKNESAWNGEWYVNFGCREGVPVDETRSWAEASQYGFVSAGGGEWYSTPFRRLRVGDRIWVKVPGVGFVGVGRVTGDPEPLAKFTIDTSTGKRRAVEVLQLGHYVRHEIANPSMCDWFVPVRWTDRVSAMSAINEPGLAGYRNTACKPRGAKWEHTIRRLKQAFPHYDA